MQMEMQQAQWNAGPNAAATTEERVHRHRRRRPNVYIVADRRHNILLANAPPAEMKIIERAIELLDVPAVRAEHSLAGNLVRVRAYRLGVPRPGCRGPHADGGRRSRSANAADGRCEKQSIIAYATLADHLTIQSVIEKLDGVGRDLGSIWLRRLRADEVAGTIQYLMVGEREEER